MTDGEILDCFDGAGLRGPVISIFGHGDGGAGLEPVSHPPADEGRRPQRGGVARFLENPENFLWTILVGNTVVNFVIFSLGAIQLYRLAGRAAGVVGAGFCAGGIYILHRLRTDAQDVVPALSQPACLAVGRAVSVDSSNSRAAGGGGGVVFARACCIGRAGKPLPDGSSAAGRNCGSSCRNRRRV